MFTDALCPRCSRLLRRRPSVPSVQGPEAGALLRAAGVRPGDGLILRRNGEVLQPRMPRVSISVLPAAENPHAARVLMGM